MNLSSLSIYTEGTDTVEINLRLYKIKQLTPRILPKVMAGIEPVIELFVKAQYLALIGENMGAVISTVALASGIDEEILWEATLSELLSVISMLISVNSIFFSKAIPAAEKRIKETLGEECSLFSGVLASLKTIA